MCDRAILWIFHPLLSAQYYSNFFADLSDHDVRDAALEVMLALCSLSSTIVEKLANCAHCMKLLVRIIKRWVICQPFNITSNLKNGSSTPAPVTSLKYSGHSASSRVDIVGAQRAAGILSLMANRFTMINSSWIALYFDDCLHSTDVICSDSFASYLRSVWPALLKLSFHTDRQTRRGYFQFKLTCMLARVLMTFSEVCIDIIISRSIRIVTCHLKSTSSPFLKMSALRRIWRKSSSEKKFLAFLLLPFLVFIWMQLTYWSQHHVGVQILCIHETTFDNILA
jgi:hypothetical protein